MKNRMVPPHGNKKHLVGGRSHVSESEIFFILNHTKFSVCTMHQQIQTGGIAGENISNESQHSLPIFCNQKLLRCKLTLKFFTA